MPKISSSDEDKEDGFDGLLTSIGFGKWQRIVSLLPALSMASYSVHMLGASLLNAPVPFRCWSQDAEISVLNEENFLNQNTLTLDTNSSYYDSLCLSSSELSFVKNPLLNVSDRFRKTSLPSCPIVEYDTSVFKSTIISKFDLVCERAYLRPVFVTLGTIGSMFGGMLGGFTGDRWGRILAVRIGAILNLIVLGCMAAAPNYSLLLLTRFLIGGSVCFCIVPSWSGALECIPNRKRAFIGMMLGLPFSFVLSAFGGVAYFVRDWVYLLLFGSSPMIILLIVAFLVPESPRWLLQKGYSEKGRRVLHWAKKVNKADAHLDVDCSTDKIILSLTEEASAAALRNPESQLPMSERFRKSLKKFLSPAMRVILLCLGISRILHLFIYVGIALNANNFTNDPFLYVILTGFIDGSSIVLIALLTPYFGRRTLLMAGLLVGGIMFFLDLAVTPDLGWLRWVLVMTGYLFIAGTVQINNIYGPEVFPTEIRARGFAFAHILGSCGASLAPFITDTLSLTVPWGPTVVFGSAGIVGGLMFSFLPETKNQPLPETIQELEENRKKKKESKVQPTHRGVENKSYFEETSDNL